MLRNFVLVYWLITVLFILGKLVKVSESFQTLKKDVEDVISKTQTNDHRLQQACFVNNQQLLALAESAAKSALQEEHRRK